MSLQQGGPPIVAWIAKTFLLGRGRQKLVTASGRARPASPWPWARAAERRLALSTTPGLSQVLEDPYSLLRSPSGCGVAGGIVLIADEYRIRRSSRRRVGVFRAKYPLLRATPSGVSRWIQLGFPS